MGGSKNISEIKNKNVRSLMYQKLKKEKQKVTLAFFILLNFILNAQS
jgi:hypothetical protein